jgi:hypothetical protein
MSGTADEKGLQLCRQEIPRHPTATTCSVLPQWQGQDSPRNEFWYVSGDGDVVAARWQDWKVVFLENRGRAFVWRGLSSWVPLLFNLRRIRSRSPTTTRIRTTIGSSIGLRAGADPDLGRAVLMTMKEYPPSQTPGSFNLSKIEAETGTVIRFPQSAIVSDGGRFSIGRRKTDVGVSVATGTLAVALVTAFTAFGHRAYAHPIPLPSWNDGAAKEIDRGFCRAHHQEGGPDFVRCPGVSRPTMTARSGPSTPIISSSPLRSIASRRWRHSIRNGRANRRSGVLEGDKRAGRSGRTGSCKSWRRRTRVTVEEFSKTVLDWTATAKHPRFNRLYTELIFQPMLELLSYLRANGFKTFIVSEVA